VEIIEISSESLICLLVPISFFRQCSR
jgi:hypothetical protein